MFILAFPDGHIEFLCLEFKSKLKLDDEPDLVDELLLQFSALNLLSKKNKNRRSKTFKVRNRRRQVRRYNRAEKRLEEEADAIVQALEEYEKKCEIERQAQTQNEPEVIILSDEEETDVDERNSLQLITRTISARNLRHYLIGPVTPYTPPETPEQLAERVDDFFRDIPEDSENYGLVTYQGESLPPESHRLRKAPTSWSLQQKNKNFFMASKNLGHSGRGASRDTIQREMKKLVETHPDVTLWCLQEAKLSQDLPIYITKQDDERMHFLKNHHEDLTGFVVEDDMKRARVLKLQEEGRVTAIYHPSLPCIVFNLYFQSGNYTKALEQGRCLETGLEVASKKNKPLVVCGDFNCVVDFRKDIIEHSDKLNATRRKYYKGEKAMMEFLLQLFKTYGLYDLFRHNNPDGVVATNHPRKEGHAERRIDRIVCHRFLLDKYLFKILKENKRISTHDIILMVQADDRELLAN